MGGASPVPHLSALSWPSGLLLSKTDDKTYITKLLLGIVVLMFNASTWEKMQEG